MTLKPTWKPTQYVELSGDWITSATFCGTPLVPVTSPGGSTKWVLPTA